jgi:hypothetical protein
MGGLTDKRAPASSNRKREGSKDRSFHAISLRLSADILINEVNMSSAVLGGGMRSRFFRLPFEGKQMTCRCILTTLYEHSDLDVVLPWH